MTPNITATFGKSLPNPHQVAAYEPQPLIEPTYDGEKKEVEARNRCTPVYTVDERRDHVFHNTLLLAKFSVDANKNSGAPHVPGFLFV